MALSTSTDSLAVGASRAFNLSPGSALTLVAPPNCRVTVTETPNTVSASGVGGNASRVHNLQLGQTVTYGPYPMGGTVVVANASNSGGAVTWVRSDALVAESASGAVSLVSGDGTRILLPIVHPRYWFHGAAALQCADDSVFRDLVGNSNGAFGANLSVANAWTNIASGYVSTIDPVGGSTDSVIRIPGPNFDYMGEESLLIFWAGQATPEGSDTDIMGTSSSTAANGVRVRCNSTGRLTFSMYDTAPTSRFGTTTTDNAAGKPFVAGERHSFGLLIDGQNRLQYMWVDGQINVNAVTISSAADVNTLSSAVWSIGTAAPAGGTTGIATKTQAFAGLKFLGTDTLPEIGNITAVAQAFHRNPAALILAGAL